MMYRTKMVKVYLFGFRLCIFSLTINLIVVAMQPFRALANEATESQAANPLHTPTALEPEIISEINRVRTDPQGYARWLEEQLQYYDGIWLRFPGEKPVRTNKGRKALSEAIAFLKNQPSLPPLSISEQTAATATSKLEDFATANNIQYISYGRVTAQGIVMGLVVDDLFPDRRRRNSLLNPDAENTGVVCKPDPRYARVCAIAYSDTAIDLEETELSDTLATAPPEISDSEANSTATETTPSVEATGIPPTSQDDTIDADLPQPPEPQVPPGLPTPDEPEMEVEPIENEELEVPEVVSQAEEDAEVEPTVDDVIVEESEAEEVAADTIVTGLLETVERGSLEQGDLVISDDGSFYDSYPLEGQAGETFNIYLESDEFDAFVALIDAEGNIVDQNDDISQEDSNSRIRVTLPEDGVYNVIVNTYDEGGTGKYVLTVSR